MRLPSSSSFRSFAVALGALLTAAGLGASPAHAGGIGLITTAGMHSDRVDYYQLDAGTGSYIQQAPDNQFNSNVGLGLELVLGDKDNKILGVFRGYYMQDAPQKAPAEGDDYVFAIRTDSRPIGVINAGLQFGIVGDPDKLQLNVVATIGSGFLTTDQTEFIVGEAGVGASYMVGRKMQLVLSATGGTRYRKLFFPTADGYLAVRYLFD